MSCMNSMLPSFLLLLLMLQVRELTAQPTETQVKESLISADEDDDFLDVPDLMDYMERKNLLGPISPGKKLSVTADFPENDEAESTGVLCIPGNKKLSVTGSNTEYYDCSEPNQVVPVLKRCPTDHTYNAAKEKCVSSVVNDEEDEQFDESEGGGEGQSKPKKNEQTNEVVQPTFGQEVFLGNPYDARRQTVYSSEFMWSKATVNANKKVRDSYSSNLDFTAVKSTLDRMKLLDISASLKLDFQGGLVHVEGSAKYFKETVQTEDISNVVMEAHYKTRSETFPTSIMADDKTPCQIKDVTHVITGIIYGMDAYFDFRREIKSDESKEIIEGELKVAIKSIPNVKIEGGAKVKIDGDLKKTADKIRAKVRGDIILEIQPTSYAECVLLYQNISSHLGARPKYPLAVPKYMILTPVKRICGAETMILLKIKNTNIMLVSRMLDEIERTKIKAKTIQHKSIVQMYLHYEKLMNLFVAKVEQYEKWLQERLGDILPKLRSGTYGETELTKLLLKYKRSPFNFDTAHTFLRTREKEIQLFDFILNPKTYKGKNVHFRIKETEKMVETVMFSKSKLMILKLNVLPDQALVNKFLAGTPVDETKSWFNDNKMIATMGAQWRRVMEFAAANKGDNNAGFIVEAYPFNKKFVNVWAMRDSRLISKDFDIPSTPPPISVISSYHNTIVVGVAKPKNQFVTKLQIRKRAFGNKEATVEVMDFNAANRYTVTGLELNTKYLLSVAYITEVGITHNSTKVGPTLTKPCSPPANIRSTSITKSSIAIAWDAPHSLGNGVTIERYNYVLKKDGYIINTKELAGKWNIAWTTKSDELEHVLGKKFPATIFRNGTIAYTIKDETKIRNLTKSAYGKLPPSLGWYTYSWDELNTAFLRLKKDGKIEYILLSNSIGCECPGMEHKDVATWCCHAAATKVPVRQQIVIKNGNSANSAKRTLDFGSLESATHYIISITAATVFNVTEKWSSHPSVSTFVTSPAPPTGPTVVTSLNSAQVSWVPPKIALGAKVKRYSVKYTQLDSNGDNVKHQTIDSKAAQARIGDLVQNSSYAISVKVITSMGESDFSPRTVAQAKYNTTELIDLEIALEKNISIVSALLKNEMTTQENKVTLLQQLKLVKIDANNKIPHSVMPAGFSKYKARDLQIEALHMAAAAACRGSTSNADSGPEIYPRATGVSCNAVCTASGGTCEGEISLEPLSRKATSSSMTVGRYENYGCASTQGAPDVLFEPEIPESVDTIPFDNNPWKLKIRISYCCCKK